ncbi:hypothetical protein CRUP_023722 [Coryphaenoides rupestris]|nr:hypothetical protein CRUP_023722 [Coryphaenoides rupestris]
MMTGWEAVPRVNCRPRGGCPVLTSKQWPSKRRYSSSYCAATTLSTWRRRRRREENQGSTQGANNAKNFITKMAKEETARALQGGVEIQSFAVGGMDVALFLDAFDGPKLDFLLSHALYCRDVLKLRRGQRAVVSNGRVIGLSGDEEVFNQDDFLLLESIILKTSGEPIKSKVQQFGIEEDRASDLVMKVDALLSAQPKGEARVEYGFADDRYSAVKIRPREGEVYFDVVAVVDPVTRDAQKVAPLLLVLKQLVNVNLRVFMNCQSRLSDLPLKR